jgi:hypothetical protein
MSFLLILFSLFFWKSAPYSFYTSIEKASPQEEEAFSILSSYLKQPFDFIGEGAQTVAFASRDGTTVLKIFKARHDKSFKLKRLIRHIRDIKHHCILSNTRWQEKFRSTCCRYQMAFEELQEETGLIALHFKASTTPLPAQLHAKGRAFQTDLRHLPFILQRRATLLPNYLESLLKEGHLQDCLTVIEQLKALFVQRTLKGFTDPRQSLSVNYGYIHGEQPIQIDVGKIEKMPVLKEHPETEIKRIHAHVDHWVQIHFPTLKGQK